MYIHAYNKLYRSTAVETTDHVIRCRGRLISSLVRHPQIELVGRISGNMIPVFWISLGTPTGEVWVVNEEDA